MRRTGIIRLFLTVMLLSVCLVPGRSLCEETFRIKRVGNIVCFSENKFEFYAPEPGVLTITIHDDICVYRELCADVDQGESTIRWDGCAFNREKLYSKTYTVTAVLEGESGHRYSLSFLSPVDYLSQTLQYVLPSSDTVSLAFPEEWFLEFRTVMRGTVRMELVSPDKPEDQYSYSMNTVGGKLNRKTFSAIAAHEFPPAGNYQAVVYEISNPDERFTFDLHIQEQPDKQEELFITGDILPERGMSDEDIWEMMMLPSVVVNIDFFKHQQVYSEPDPKSSPLGTLHGQTQALKVIRLEDGWAFIGAWNHEEAAYIEGWVPADKLKVVRPQRDYGLLIDKQSQTMTVYYRGEKIDTLLVSTGRAEYGHYDQETAAGSFLTGYHRVDFSMNGKKYDYVIQYDGGNLLHQTPYHWGEHKKDFTLGRGYLGAKASHACIRIQADPGEGGLNAYWLWTHIPYHSRVMILDDPQERTDSINRLKRSKQKKQAGPERAVQYVESPDESGPGKVVLTFTGRLIPGGSASFNAREQSFVSFVSHGGYEKVFYGLSRYLSTDDLTVTDLRGVLLRTEESSILSKGIDSAPGSMAGLFRSSSVEMVSLTDDAIYDQGQDMFAGTEEAIRPYASVMDRNTGASVSLKGHLFGFAGCSEREYLRDPTIVDQRVSALKEAGCERIVFLCGWSNEKNRTHSIVQEAMAHRSIRAGVSLVVGWHPSYIQGIDYYEGVPVVYSAGILLDGSGPASSRASGLLIRAVFDTEGGTDNPEICLIPVKQSAESRQKSEESGFCPSADLSPYEYAQILDWILEDTTDTAVQRIRFCRTPE